jgi:hypothetical protein
MAKYITLLLAALGLTALLEQRYAELHEKSKEMVIFGWCLIVAAFLVLVLDLSRR